MVTLSGGDLGGTQVDGTGWELGTEQTISGLKYRRDTQTTAVFTGMA